MKNDLFELEIPENGIAVLWLDKKGSKQNTFSAELIPHIENVLEELNSNDSIKALIITSGKKDFVAGADIEQFQKFRGQDGYFVNLTSTVHGLFNSLENSKKPIVAAIDGSCMGAGLELALACHSRILTDSSHTKLALPEVKLGILPGTGGTQRLPALVGLQKALEIMTTGKNIYPYPAKKMNLVDAVVHSSKLMSASIQMAEKLISKPINRKDNRSFLNRILDGPARGIVFNQARKQVDKATHGNYPAPYAIIDCVEHGLKHGREKGFQKESIEFERLINTPESKELVNIFFAMTENKKVPNGELAKKVDYIAMLGAGFMGEGISEVSAVKDIKVKLKDIKEETIAKARKGIWKNLSKKVKRRAMTKVDAEMVMSNIHSQLDYKDFDSVDVVIEAVFESLDLKKSIIKEVEATTKKDCIFASNTSALPISEIAKASKRKENVIGMHYFSPVPKMPLLEIIKTKDTADWVIATCYGLGVKQGKTVIVVEDGPGFYTTRILSAMLNEALLLMEEGADALIIDKCLQKFGFPVGPVTLMDEVGIDVGAHIMKGELATEFMKRDGAKMSQALASMAELGYAGKKNGKGFYQYDAKTKKKIKGKLNPAAYQFTGGGPRKKIDIDYITERCALAFINEAAHCLDDGIISSPTDGDIGAIFGLGFPPFLGGPFRYIDNVGAQQIYERLTVLSEKATNRYQPAKCIQKMASKENTFYNK